MLCSQLYCEDLAVGGCLSNFLAEFSTVSFSAVMWGPSKEAERNISLICDLYYVSGFLSMLLYAVLAAICVVFAWFATLVTW